MGIAFETRGSAHEEWLGVLQEHGSLGYRPATCSVSAHHHRQIPRCTYSNSDFYVRVWSITKECRLPMTMSALHNGTNAHNIPSWILKAYAAGTSLEKRTYALLPHQA